MHVPLNLKTRTLGFVRMNYTVISISSITSILHPLNSYIQLSITGGSCLSGSIIQLWSSVPCVRFSSSCPRSFLSYLSPISCYYSGVCFFLLFHSCCSHARGILCEIHNSCMGSPFPIVYTECLYCISGRLSFN